MFECSLLGTRDRLIALLCLLSIGSSASGVLAGVAVLVGQLDSDHQVLVCSSGGALEVRFRHFGGEDDSVLGVLQSSTKVAFFTRCYASCKLRFGIEYV